MTKLYQKCFLAFLLALCSTTINAQLTGTKNIPGDYADLAAAITDLNAVGVGAGGVVLNLLAGNPQTAPTGGYVIGGTGSLILTTSSVSNPIYVIGNGNTITASASHTAGSFSDAIIKLVGADFVTINGFILTENAANTVMTAASNTMTEWGIALLYVSVTDGSQGDTLSNNTIDLDRTYPNSFGIYSNSTHAAGAPGTSVPATGPTGGNHNLMIVSNSITDVNIGIVIIGPTAAADHNDGLFIGASVSTGNTITNFGSTGTFTTSFANVSGTVNGILVRNTKNFTVAYNTITSSNGGVTAGTLNGIQVIAFSNAPTGTFTNNINNNNISLTSGVAGGVINGINSAATTASVTSTMNINSNNFSNFGHTVAGTAAIIFITQTGTHLIQNINNNTFTNISVNTTGSVTFISSNATLPANATKSVSNNSIVTGFNKTVAGGTVQFYISNSASPTSVTEINTGNNFSNITVTGATIIAGWQSSDGSTTSPYGPVKTVTNNIFNNITGGTSATTILNVGYSSSAGNTTVTGNSITNINGAGNVTGFTSTGGSQRIYNNIIHSLSTSGASTLIGISITSGLVQDIYNHKLYNLTGSNAGVSIYGISISGTTSNLVANVYNNYIGELTAPNSAVADAIRGISVTGAGLTSSYNVSFNTIYLNASSVGATFGTSGVFHSTSTTATTGTLNLRNNNIVNTSTSSGSGITVAYRRSSVTLTNYGSLSNNNNFYAPVLFSDGTNSDLTIGALKSRLSPRDVSSVSENVNFLSVSGANADFLHINPATASQLESAATPVSGITTDFDGDTRNVSTPDIGADEFIGIALDATGPTITTGEVFNTCNTTRTLTATITDISGVPTAGIGLPIVYWNINGGAYTAATGTHTGGGIYQFIIGTGSVAGDYIDYYYAAQDNAPTPNVSIYPFGGSASVTSNPPAAGTVPTTPLRYYVTAPLTGTYTVGVGGNFTTLTAAVTAYNNAGCLTGAVTFSLIDAAYPSETYPIIINSNAVTDATNNLTIKAGNAATTISGSLASSALIRIVDNFVTIDGAISGTTRNLTITNTSTTSPSVLHLGSAGTTPLLNVTVKNSIIINGINSSSALVVSDLTTLGNPGYFNNISITNNEIQKAYIGSYINAFLTAGNGSGTIVNNNSLAVSGANAIRLVGLYFQGVDGAIVRNNTLANFETTTAENDRGIWLATGSKNILVEKNNISNLLYTGTGGYGGQGIYVSTGVTDANINISNNMISNLAGDGFSYITTPTRNPLGIGLSGTQTGIGIFYNSIHLYGNTLNQANALSMGIYLSTGSSADIRNNILANNLGLLAATGYGSAGIVAGTSNAQFTAINNNNYYINPSGTGVKLFGQIASTGQPTLAGWQTASGGDAASVTVQPYFVSNTDLHLDPLQAGNAFLDNLGSPVAGILLDFDSNLRDPSNPDMGADEFSFGVIPITIEYFRGSKQTAGNRLDWKVACYNSPSATMTLERSSDGRSFAGINTQTETATRCLQPFDYFDASPLTGINYYRLKSVDADGKISYSNIVALLNQPKGFEFAGLKPNPVQNTAIFSISSAIASKIELVISDISGKVIGKQAMNLVAGENQINMNFSKLAAGSYQITGYTADGQIRTLRFVKQ